MMATRINNHLEGVLDLVDQMVKMADRGMLDDSTDNGFYLLYGMILDDAYKIRNATVKEYTMRNLAIPLKYNTPAK